MISFDAETSAYLFPGSTHERGWPWPFHAFRDEKFNAPLVEKNANILALGLIHNHGSKSNSAKDCNCITHKSSPKTE